MRETSSKTTDGGKEKTEVLDIASGEENVFGTRGEATDFFPASSYRTYQRETIEKVEAAFERGYQYVVLDAPTGSGKSLIGISFARQADDAHYLTIQKILQDQIEKEFPEIFIMKGRTAYKCLKSPSDEDLNCGEGPCRTTKAVECYELDEDGNEISICPYRVAKKLANEAAITCHNFDSFFWNNRWKGGFTGRKLLIIDEAHNIGQKYSEFMGFTIRSEDHGMQVPEYETLEEYDEFLVKLRVSYQAEYDRMKEWRKYDGLSKEQLKKMDELGRLIAKLTSYIADREQKNPAEYVFDYKKNDGRYGPSVVFRPVMVGKFTQKKLFPYGERCLMMSATILDKDLFCREVGLDPDEVCYISVPSSFPAVNRPIIRKYVGSMTFKSIDENLPKLVEEIERILDKYPDRKGIIQTHSDKIASYLQANLKGDRYTYNKDYATPQVMMMVHRTKPGSFIVASGLREGLDLRGDLSKVQILCKIPYPSLADKKVKRRMELDPAWYGWQTALMFVQILGRSVRSSKEKAVTFVLDSNFGYFYQKNKEFLPKYVKEAISWSG